VATEEVEAVVALTVVAAEVAAEEAEVAAEEVREAEVEEATEEAAEEAEVAAEEAEVAAEEAEVAAEEAEVGATEEAEVAAAEEELLVAPVQTNPVYEVLQVLPEGQLLLEHSSSTMTIGASVSTNPGAWGTHPYRPTISSPGRVLNRKIEPVCAVPKVPLTRPPFVRNTKPAIS